MFNVSQFRPTSQHGAEATTYLLDVNRYYVFRSGDAANKIDARWIDLSNGKFLDITAVQPDGTQRLQCKDGHSYKVNNPR